MVMIGKICTNKKVKNILNLVNRREFSELALTNYRVMFTQKMKKKQKKYSEKRVQKERLPLLIEAQ